LNPRSAPLLATELSGGVSATVIAVQGDGVAVLLKQALSRLRVEDPWKASPDRTETEAAALNLLGDLTPAVVPRVPAPDPSPDVASAVGVCAEELRSIRRCVVDGDYAPKNMLVAPDGRAWVVDLEVAHIGNPIFDLAFFLSFVLLSAIQWPVLAPELRTLGDR